MNAQPEKTELEKKLEAEAAARAASSEAADQRRDGMESEKQVPPDETMTEEPEIFEGEADEELPEVVPAADFQTLIQERNELKDQLLRARAEFDNFRKRVTRDAEQVRQRAAESLIRDLLPVLDNLELALQHAAPDDPLAEGVSMVMRQFQDALRRAGVEPIGAVGETFDPIVHDAVMHAPSEDVPENNVTHEFQRGYRLGNYVLRPSRVAVSKGTPETPAEGDSAE